VLQPKSRRHQKLMSDKDSIVSICRDPRSSDNRHTNRCCSQSMSWPISDSMLSLPALSMLPSGSVLHLKTSTVDSKARTASELE